MKNKKIKNLNAIGLVWLIMYTLPILTLIGYIMFNFHNTDFTSLSDYLAYLLTLVSSESNVLYNAIYECVSYLYTPNLITQIAIYYISYVFIIEIIRIVYDLITFLFNVMCDFLERGR